MALNRAVGHAFAHSVGRPVVIPPSPELLGALGVALLALERSGAVRRCTATDLLSLAAPEMKLVGRFTCGACKMYCSIDRFEVGRPALPVRRPLQPVRERLEAKVAHRGGAAIWSEQRAELLFGDVPAGRAAEGRSRPRIGIPEGAHDALALPALRDLLLRAGDGGRSCPAWTRGAI